MPERTCIVCRKSADKSSLVRFVSKEGRLEPDFRGAAPGRGAYLCPGGQCLKDASRRKDAFQRALRTKLTVPDQVEFWDKISAGFKELSNNKTV